MLVDTTLREGAQAVGVRLAPRLRTRIARGLLEAGVEMLEIGWIGHKGLRQVARALVHDGLGSRLAVWSPCRPENMAAAADLGVGSVHVGVPASSRHREARLRMDLVQAEELMAITISEARRHGLRVRVGCEDASGATEDELIHLARAAERAGAVGIRLADTRGVWTPAACSASVRQVQAALSLPVGVHCHNDFGMATANALSALDAGAAFADVSLLGLGERAGISALEEVAGYLTVVRQSHGYAMDRIRRLCHELAAGLGLGIPRTKAIAGEAVFASESGLHVDGLLKDPSLFEPCPPESLGARRQLFWGNKSGRGAVARLLVHHGIHLEPREVENVLRQVRRCGTLRPLPAAEVLELARRPGVASRKGGG